MDEFLYRILKTTIAADSGSAMSKDSKGGSKPTQAIILQRIVEMYEARTRI